MIPSPYIFLFYRYASFEDDTVPKFMYGSHYSTAGVVLHYHVRQDPFTTLHINLQARNWHIALHSFLLAVTVSEPFVKPCPEKQYTIAHRVLNFHIIIRFPVGHIGSGTQ